MAVLKIYKYPHPILREVCKPVTVWNDEIRQLIADMVETMYASPGAVGLAANQVGSTHRIMVIDVAAKTTRDQLKVFVNPEITQASRNKVMREGCLSFPEYLANVKRAQKITVQCLDENQQPQEYEFHQFEAVAVQHEMDHLDGILFIDRINSIKTDLIRRQSNPAIQEGK
jgi:peptide deformylase